MQIIALDPATPQLRAPPSGSTYAAPRAIAMTPEPLTGSAATSSLSIAQTWNTTGTPTAIDLNVTDTASNASSLLMNLRVGGTTQFSVSKAGASTAATGYGISTDVLLRRDAANTLAQRNGVNAQAFNIYNTYTDASNYERLEAVWSSNVLFLRTAHAGTGSARALKIQSGGTIEINGGVIGDFFRFGVGSNYAATLNNFGLSGTSYTAADVFMSRVGAGILRISANISDSVGAALDLREMTAPAAPAADRVRIFAQDNGAGKTQLMARFATGAAQQIAIEP